MSSFASDSFIVSGQQLAASGTNYTGLYFNGNLIGLPITPIYLPCSTGLLVSGNTNLLTYRCLLTGNVTILPPAGAIDGAKIKFWLTASGANYTFTLASGIVVPKASIFTGTQTILSGQKVKLMFEYDAIQNGGQYELTSYISGY